MLKKIKIIQDSLKSINEVIESLNEDLSKSKNDIIPMSEDRGAFYENEYGLGYLGDKIDNKLILISLICSFTLMVRKQNPSVTVMDCIKKLTDYESLPMNIKSSHVGKFYENLAIVCESFMYGVTEGNTFGLKNGLELKNKVTEIINNQVPF